MHCTELRVRSCPRGQSPFDFEHLIGTAQLVAEKVLRKLNMGLGG